MLVTIESATRETRTLQDGTVYTGLKINGEWKNARGDLRSLYKKQVDVEFKEGSKWVRVNQSGAQQPSAPTQAVGIPWADYKALAWEAGVLAQQLAPDLPPDKDTNDPFVDRAQARTAIVNTILIAYSNGKIAYKPEDGNGVIDDEIPF